MKKLFALLSLVVTTTSFATVTCQDIKSLMDQDDFNGFEIIKKVKIVNEQNWKDFDVIANFDRRNCIKKLDQELISINDQKFIRIETNNDSCDGGNTYGVIYSEDLTTVIAHINDSDLYCDDWQPENLASNHRCDIGAEEFAVSKMLAKGFNMVNVTSTLEYRKSYVYSFIHVEGKLEGPTEINGDDVVVKVSTDLTNCKNRDAVITGLRL